ncbi:peptidase M28 [Lewinellaceae bacterium SD302]|nr:peptidase M28 [Lewinellaceae bacterium SD302]
MKNLILFAVCFLGTAALSAQEYSDLPESNLDREVLKGQMYFLASDYLAGRRTGSVGNEIAAEYIASQLEGFGYEPLNGDSYFQEVPMQSIAAPDNYGLAINGISFTPGENLLQMRGTAPVNIKKANVVFAGHGWVDAETGHDDYKDLDVKGKIVVTFSGLPEDMSQSAIFRGIQEKAGLAAERGAVALYEVYRLPFPFKAFVNYFGGERLGLAPDEEQPSSPIPYGFLKAEDNFIPQLRTAKKPRGMVMSTGMKVKKVMSRNVGGVLEGSNPELKDEYILLTAHFDHVGVGAQGGGAYTPEDSIFNGARDNAFGTISLLSAAKSFAQEKPERSIIILAVTGEELGLLGSQYYAEHPIIPLDEVVYNFNTDGAGYSDVTAISIFGMGRTGVDDQINAGAAAIGVEVVGDPAPEQGLYDRSDNVSFAAKGVPALTFSPGFREFDDTMMKYYHQVTDNPNTIDYDYLLKYCQSFTYIARLIANMEGRPFWAEGDKYEEAGKMLYNRK